MAENELLKPYSSNVADSNEILDCHLINWWNVRFSTIANNSQYCWCRPIPVMVAGNLATGNLATDLVTSQQKAEYI